MDPTQEDMGPYKYVVYCQNKEEFYQSEIAIGPFDFKSDAERHANDIKYPGCEHKVLELWIPEDD